MKIFFVLTAILVLFISNTAFTQEYEVSGTISDAKTNKPLEYVTLKIADTSYGTTCDKSGKYFINLKKGPYKLIFSYIGYQTDTAFVYVEDKNIKRDIFLKPSELMTETIEVYGEDPAYEIIRKAIKYKKEFKRKLNEYEYDAFSKFVIRSNRSDIPKSDIPVDSTGSSKLGIYGILESETKGYFKKPDLEKQIVIAKKETANIVRGFAIPLIVNFYDEKIDFNEFEIPTPLADNAFDHYDYKLTGTTSMDSTVIYKIEVINNSNNIPLLYGTIYIADSIYALMKVELTTNDAAKPVGFNKIIFDQKFSSYKDRENVNNLFWMPTDVHIFASGSYIGIIKFEADVFTIVSDYQLNKKAPKGIFDEFIVTVMPDAKKDSAYWRKNELIKNTSEEKYAYKKIEIEDKKKDKEIAFGLTSLTYGRKFSSSPLNYYHFNRVEGNSLLFDLNYKAGINRTIAGAYFGYGFADKKTKYNLTFTQRLLEDKRLTLTAGAFQKIEPLSYPDYFGISVFYNTLKCLFVKKDNVDYDYTVGYNLGVNYNIIPQFGLGLTFLQEKQTTAYKNSNFSILKPDEQYIANPPINDAFQRIIGVTMRISPNKYQAIDWGNDDISRFKVTNYPEVVLGFKYAGKEFNSTYEYRKFTMQVKGDNYFSSLINFRYLLGAEIGSGQIPIQSLLFFRTNTGTIDAPLGFTTMQYQEFLGDKMFYFNFENNFGKLLWGGIPVLKNFNMIGLFSIGRNTISEANREFAAYQGFTITHGYFMEAGFGIGRILDVFRIDFAWRLNNFDDTRSKLYSNLVFQLF